MIGGPPCQAYSVVGRSRMMGNPDFEADERHFLYREYLKIIIDHMPPVFVMENVKGLLSAQVNGEPMIDKIVNDLSSPVRAIKGSNNGLNYRLYSLSCSGGIKDDIDLRRFIVEAEKYGVPQARHRMFILGIRSDINIRPSILKENKAAHDRTSDRQHAKNPQRFIPAKRFRRWVEKRYCFCKHLRVAAA